MPRSPHKYELLKLHRNDYLPPAERDSCGRCEHVRIEGYFARCTLHKAAVAKLGICKFYRVRTQTP